MDNQNQEQASTEEVQTPDELTVLKDRADRLGLKYHPSISAEKLREKIAAHLADQPDPEAAAPKAVAAAAPAVETEGQKRHRLKQEALKLVRIRVTCMNPAKKEWDGEIFTVGNAAIGSVKKFVPFNVEDGWHVPNCIYEMMKNRMCQVFVTGKTRAGVTTREGKLIREFAIEVLPQLSQEELDELARRQAMAKSID